MIIFEAIIAQLKETDPAKAEHIEEEIDIIVHKLKFLPADSIPNVAILDQKNDFVPIYQELLAEKTKIAGGNLIRNLEENPQVIIVIQDSEDLYHVLPSYLFDLKNQKVRALLENKVFIIQGDDFKDDIETLVRDTEVLSEIIQPKYFFFGRDGKDWVKFDL